QKYGHFADECWVDKKEPENKLAKQDDEDVLLMVTTKEENKYSDLWYLDSGCSSHMTGRFDWFVSINKSMKSRVKFADDSALSAEGVGDVLIKRKD
ncbi:retrovirus-related pol polyprotein from transposon TNT 1-94, partial [Trifolium medium]|nr:retrovirus-related pol polyprotein from transposon TNT 1-94 [Trifolium medium]